MDDVLPSFVGQLLRQGRGPSRIPEIVVSAAAEWLQPLASRVLPLLDTGTYRAAGAFLAHGFAYLPLQTPDAYTIYLRVSDTRAIARWNVHVPTTVLTVAGATALEMYLNPEDAQSGRPQYARTFGAGEFFAAHPGALYATRTTGSTVQVLATTKPVIDRDGPLYGEAYSGFARQARRYLEQASRAQVGASC
ncbi:hypothetical protein SCANM63S_01771 [Streptomyces canarius]